MTAELQIVKSCLTIDETKGAEKSIVQCVQYKVFSDVISRLKSKNDQLPKSCNLKWLSPFLSDNLISSRRQIRYVMAGV